MESDNIFPDNWKEIVRGKKVIFYNTSVGSMLSGREKHIEKMKWVFNVFREHPEVVLWWRPHPLELATIESMIPELKKQYIELRNYYKDSQMGILDESTDLHRAIAISDAYYGDWSSVVQLYKTTKKPVLYEKDKVKDLQDTSFFPGTLCVKDQYIWFIQMNTNKLVKVNRFTFEVKDIISIPLERSYKHHMYYHIIDIGDRLLLLFGKSKNIYEYELETQNINAFPLNASSSGFHSEIVIGQEDKLILFPYQDNKVLEYHYQSNNVINEEWKGCNNVKAAGGYEVIEEKIYMIDSGSNRVYKYDLISHTYIQVEVGNKQSKYWGIKKAGKYFVIPHIDKMIITLWNEETGEVLELTDFPEHYTCLRDNAYLSMFEEKGFMYIFPFYANMILKIDVQNKMIAQEFQDAFFEADYDLHSENLSGAMYLCAKRYGCSIYAYALYKRCWQIFDVNSKSIQNSPVFEIKAAEHKKLIETLLDTKMDEEESFCEGEMSAICTLDNYIDNVCLIQRCDNQLYGDCIGTNIHKFIMNEV